MKAAFSSIDSPLDQALSGPCIMASEKVQERMERWLAKAHSHHLSKREADLVLLLANDTGAWERYGQFYEGWTLGEVTELLKAVKAAG